MAMNELEQSFQMNQQPQGAVSQASSSREMEEVKGQIFMAKQFPRNIFQAQNRILDACKRPSLAQTAVYRYPKGGAMVEGPSIRMAEVIAQNWGNIDFGVKELEQGKEESKVLAYAWDLETNTRQTKLFTMSHSYMAKGKIKKLTDERDIYEHVANLAARRMRACILSIIPGDIVEAAMKQCYATLAGQSTKPLKDRVQSMLKAFKERYQVTQEQIEEYFGYNCDAFTEIDIAKAISLFNSIKDGMVKPYEVFGPKKKEEKKAETLSDELTKDFEKADKEVKKDAKPSDSKAKKDAPKAEQGELPFD